MSDAVEAAETAPEGFEPPETYEEGLERLEAVVKQLEQEDLPLDTALALFQEGVTLARHCAAYLDEAETRIEALMEDEEGTLERVPFEAQEDLP